MKKRLLFVFLAVFTAVNAFAEAWPNPEALTASDAFQVWRYSPGVLRFKIRALAQTFRDPNEKDQFVHVDHAFISQGLGTLWSVSIGKYCDSSSNSTDSVKIAIFGISAKCSAEQIVPIGGSTRYYMESPIFSPTTAITNYINGVDLGVDLWYEFLWSLPSELIDIQPNQLSFKVLTTRGADMDNCSYYPETGASYDLSMTNYNEGTFMVPTSVFAVDNGDAESAPGKMMCPVVSTTGATISQYRIYINGSTDGTDHIKTDDSNNLYVPISDASQTVYFEVAGDAIDGIEGHFYARYKTDEIQVPAYHKLYDVKAAWNTEPKTGLYDGSVKISWNIKNAAEDDYMNNDLFVIERDTLANFSTAQAIGSVNYEVGKADYEFVDESDVIKRQQTSGGKYYYRVYRASASFWTDKKAVDDSGLGGRTSINVPGVWQAEIKSGSATAASDWNATRNVNISATVAQVMASIGIWRK